MRYGVLSDIHGNLPALVAAIDRLRREGVDRWLCAGDLIGYGPQPNECVAAVAALDALCVAGNHESMLLGDLPAGGGRLVRETAGWTSAALSDDSRDYLQRLAPVVTLPGLVMTHAALEDRSRYISEEADAAEQLRRLEAGHPGARILILGHTHRQWVYEGGRGSLGLGPGAVPLAGRGRLLLNPGAIGQSRERELRPRARFMLLDMGRAQLRAFQEPYDVRAVKRSLRRHRLPYEVVHRPPGVLATRRRARRLLRALAGSGVHSTSPVR